MKLTAAIAGAALVLGAGYALAEGGPRPAEIAAFTKALAKAGCTLTPVNAAGVVKASGLTGEEAAAVIQRLNDQGKLTNGPENSVTLRPEDCK